MNQPIDTDQYHDSQTVGAITTMAQDTEGPASPFRKIHAILRGRYLWAIMLGLIGAVATGSAAQMQYKPKFMSRGLLSIAPVMPRMIYDNERSNVMPMFDAFVGTQVELITSQRVLHKAMESEEWHNTGRGFTPEAQSDFSEAIEVRRPARTNMIFVTFTDHNPKVAVTGVKTVIAAYEEIFGEKDVVSGNVRMQVLTTRKANLQTELNGMREQLQVMSNDLGPSAYGQMHQWKMTELSDLQDQISQTNLALVAAGQAKPKDANLDKVESEKLLIEQQIERLNQLAQSDPTLGAMLSRRSDILLMLEQNWISGLGEKHRRVRQHLALLQSMEQRISTHVKARNSGSVLYGPLSGLTQKELRDQLEQLQAMKEETIGAAQILSRRMLDIQKMQDHILDIQQKLRDTATRIDQLNVETMSKVGGRIDIISRGELPMMPINIGKRKQLTLFAVFGGGILGSSLVLLVGVLDRRLRSSEDARESMGSVRVLGILPGLPDDLSDPEHAQIAGYCVHHIRTMLQLDTNRPERKVFAITSPAGGTGKTSLTLALGLSFAASGSRTLLVDCDLSGGGLTSRLRTIIHRRIGQILQRQGLLTSQQLEEALQHATTTGSRLGESLINLGVLSQEDLDRALNIQEDARVGLLDALDGEDFDHCIAQTNTKGLSILPIGGANAYDMSRLSPSAIRRIIDLARQRYDVILLDAGSIPSTVETSMVAAEADDVVLVVSRGDQKPLAENAISFLESIGAHIAGVVFNRAAAGDVARSVHALSRNPSKPVAEDDQGGPPPTVTESENFGPVARAVVDTSHQTTDRK